MIDIKLAQKEPEIVARALKLRNSEIDINEFIKLDTKRRNLLAEVEQMKARQNKASQEIGRRKREGADASALITEMSELANKIKKLDIEVSEIKSAVENWLYAVPNIPHETTPIGKDEQDNVEIRKWGAPRVFDFTPKEHGELGILQGGLDFERASMLTGSRFVVEKAWAAQLGRALGNYFIDRHTIKEDYVEIYPPLMVNRGTMTGTGQLPKFEEDLFRISEWDYFLIPTAEVPLTNLHANDIIPEEILPLAYCANTACFRAEAGAAGRDTKGLIRMHQFNKVEMVRFSHPDESFNQLEIMTSQAAGLLEELGLPYRIISLCTGDLGFGAAKTYDLEVWFPTQKTYREISSCSNCTDFQARRANIKYKPKSGKAIYLHTLNGSGLPIGRTMASIIENYQQKDGTIKVPDVLQPYLGGRKTLGNPIF